MLRATWRSLFARKLRLLLSAFAVVLGVAFVSGSYVFTDTLDRAFTGLTSGAVGDVIVRPGSSADSGGGFGGGTSGARTVPATCPVRPCYRFLAPLSCPLRRTPRTGTGESGGVWPQGA